MTPDDATVDRWRAMTLQLSGEALPAPPPLPGRRHHPVDDGRDRRAEQWELLEARIKPGWMGPRP